MKAIFFFVASAVATAGLSAGCTRAQAKVTLEPPPLNVPMPPARVVETAVVEAAAPAQPEQEPVADVTPPRVTPQPPRQSRPAEAKPTEPVETAVKPEDAPRPVPTPLQALPPQQEGKEEARIRTAINSANTNLGRVDYRALGNDGRTQYEIAKGLIKQAEDALKAKNFVFAWSSAERAATLAAQLAGR
jgi:outer membrane biosynthesis protein TonB